MAEQDFVYLFMYLFFQSFSPNESILSVSSSYLVKLKLSNVEQQICHVDFKILL